MRKKSITFLVFCLVAISSIAYATTIVDLIGDKDGFGISAIDGNTFDSSLIGIGDGDGTDVWMSGDYTYTHTYDISGLATITSASLEIFTGGGHNTQESMISIYLDSSLGFVKVSDLQNGVVDGDNVARLDTFDLMAYSSALLGSTTLMIETQTKNDEWVLDYSQLTISGVSGLFDVSLDSTPVPEPATMILFSLGLLGIAGVSRKKLQK